MPKTNHKKQLKKAVYDFLENTPPARLSRALRTMLLLLLEYEEGLLPDDLRDLPFDMMRLFVLLDAAENCRGDG